MNINFKGIRNAGAYTKLNKEDLTLLEENGRRFGIPKGKLSVISLELTNEGKKDLDEFKEILKNYPNRFNPQMLNLDIQEQLEYKKTQFMINGKAIKMNRENLKTFAKIFRLLDRISKMPAEEIKTENSHLSKPETFASFGTLALFYRKLEDFMQVIDKAHYPEPVKKVSKHISTVFEKELVDYLNS